MISKVLLEVEKVMVAVIGGLKWRRDVLEAMKAGGTCVSGVWYLVVAALARVAGSAWGLHLWWCCSSTESWFPGCESSRSSLRCLYAKGIVLWSRAFSRVKTQDLRSGYDNVSALFPSWRRCFWRIYSAVRVLSSLMVRVLLLRLFNHLNEVFVLLSLSFYFFCWLCAPFMSYTLSWISFLNQRSNLSP
jgi:hypothetical protein